MRRVSLSLLLGLLSAVCVAPSAPAQEWAEAMFRERSHDFGTVAAYAKSEYRFTVTNKYKETMNLLDVRSSCGCTSPSITKRSIKTGETSEIVAVYNTHSFRGQRSAVLTVSFGDPFPAQVQLRISGYIRGDVVLNPASVDFGRVAQGAPAERAIEISYAGRSDWKITDVQSASEFLTASLTETKRAGGLVDYRLVVRLKGGAPVGYVHDRLSLVTSDASGNRIPLEVEGKVEPEVSVSPSPLVFGTVKPGEKLSKKVVVRGSKPFRLTAANAPEFLSVQFDKDAKTFHVVEVVLSAEKPGSLSGKIRFETDLGPTAAVELPASAVVAEERKADERKP